MHTNKKNQAALNYTFTMIKPGAVNHEHIGPILHIINEHHFKIIALKFLKLTKEQAELFYAEHKEKSFFNDLVEFMTSGPIVAAILEKENAVVEYRKLIGNTDPHKAEKGTIRYQFAESMQRNAVHGSDCDDAAQRESNFFFSVFERYQYQID